jgi:hypothetical protein
VCRSCSGADDRIPSSADAGEQAKRNARRSPGFHRAPQSGSTPCHAETAWKSSKSAGRNPALRREAACSATARLRPASPR